MLKWIVIYGKDMDSYGPFDTLKQAESWAREYFRTGYTIKQLHRPA